MRRQDYYDILNLKKDCQPQEIKKTYYNLALQWHPDKHHNKEEATSKFNEIREAYSVLSDPDQRKIYDKYGHRKYKHFSENSGNAQKSNIFFTKGFQGTEKSAFDILWDILKDEPEEFPRFKRNNSNERSFFPTFASFEIPSPEPNSSNFAEEQFFPKVSRKSSSIFGNNESPVFEDNSFFDLLSRLGRTDSHLNKQSEFKRQNSGLPNDFDFQNLFSNQRSPSPKSNNYFSTDFHRQQPTYIIIEDNEILSPKERENSHLQSQFIESFSSQLQEFQSYINDFDQKIEENLGLLASSKKINKPKRSSDHILNAKARKQFHRMPLNVIPETSIPS